jgi:hypothetical protein
MAEKPDNELKAMEAAFNALKGLEQEKQVRVLAWLGQKLGVVSAGNPALVKTAPAVSPVTGGVSAPPGVGVSTTPKSFTTEKKPKSDIERVVCLAYYLTHQVGTPKFKTKDLSKLNGEAAQPTFSNAAFAVTNATNAAYFAPAGGGLKQITSKGEALVEALPDREKVKAVLEAHPLRQRKRKSAKKARK